MIKAAVQSVLARVPYGEEINHKLQRAVKSEGDNRFKDVIGSLGHLASHASLSDAVVVEAGTGWDALPTVWLAAHGTERIHTYDHLPHLRLDLAKASATLLLRHYPGNKRLIAMEAASTLKDFLSEGGIEYHAPADATKTTIREASVDVYFSYAVLEHVPEDVIDNMIAEAKKILKPGGTFFAVVGLHDHYVGMNGASKVNFLRYPEWLWSALVKNKFSYHNRLRERDFLDRLAAFGATIVDVRSRTDPADLQQVQSMKIDSRFSRYSLPELAVSRTEILAKF